MELKSAYWVFLFGFDLLDSGEIRKLHDGFVFHCEPESRTEAVLHNTKLPLMLPPSVRESFG